MKKGILMLIMAVVIGACSSAEKTTGEGVVSKEGEGWWIEAGEADSEYWWVYNYEGDSSE